MGEGRWSVGRIQIILDASCLRVASFPDLLEFPVCDGGVHLSTQACKVGKREWGRKRPERQ